MSLERPWKNRPISPISISATARPADSATAPAPLAEHSIAPAAPAPLAAHSILPAAPAPLEAHSVPVPPFTEARPHDMLTTFEFTKSGKPLTPDEAEFMLSVYPKVQGRMRENVEAFLRRALQLLSDGIPAVSGNSLAEDGDLMHAFMHAAQVFDSPGYKKMSDTVSDYIERNLYDKETGAFFDSRAGERAIYTCPNARVALGYLRGYRTTGDRLYLSTARDVVDYLIKQLNSTGGETPASGQPMCRASHLTNMVFAGMAALQVYEATGEANYLDFALKAAGEIEAGKFRTGTEPVIDASRAAILLADLSDITGDKKHLQAARRLLSELAATMRGPASWPGTYALAVERVGGGSYDFVVVGKMGDAGTADLVKKSYTFEGPDRVVLVLDPGRDKRRLDELGYEYEGKPMLYVCSDKTCFNPVAPGESLAKTREAMRKAAEVEKN